MKHIVFKSPSGEEVGTLTIEDGVKVEYTGLGRLFQKFGYERSGSDHDGVMEETITPSEGQWEDCHHLIAELAKTILVEVVE